MLATLLGVAVFLSISLGLFAPLEAWAPAVPRRRLGLKAALACVALFTVNTVLMSTAGGAVLDALGALAAPRPFSVWRLGLALVLGDVCGYWLHRAMHHVPALWRWHRVHHAPTHLGWRQYRSLGATALDLCSVADGSVDGTVDCTDSALGPWDYLGAMLVLGEAGGWIADAHGRDLLELQHTTRRTPVAAATPELFEELLAARSRMQVHTWE